MSDEIMLMRKWYANRYVLYETFWSTKLHKDSHYLADREFQVIVPKHRRNNQPFESIKVLHATNPDNITYILNNMVKYEYRQKPYNLYFSLAAYKDGIPKTDCNIMLPSRKKITESWKQNHHEQMIAYDCFIDIDSPDHKEESMEEAKQGCQSIMEYLDGYEVPYVVRFSGCGYHLLIPYKFFSQLKLSFNPDEYPNIYSFYNAIAHKLNINLCGFVDETIHDSRRVCKLPYSLAFYEDGTFVCWPFKDKQEFRLHHFEDYKILPYTPENGSCHFRGEQRIFKRGQTLFNADGLDKPQLLLPFLDSLKIKKVMFCHKKEKLPKMT